MSHQDAVQPGPSGIDHETTLVLAIELSSRSWVLAAQVPGLPRVKSRRTIEPSKEALGAALAGYRARAAAAGRATERVIAIYEAGWSGFWLARWLAGQGVEAHIVHPSSVPVDRRSRRAKSDGIDAELLLRTLLAWLRGEPRVCSMVPVPDADEEDARRPVRERAELVSERVGLVNRIGSVLATLGVADYNPMLQSRRRRLDELRTGLGEPLPVNARAKIERLLARLELVLEQIAELERERDAVVESEAGDPAARMIRQLTGLRGIGVQSATVLVREAFVRRFPTARRSALMPASPRRPTAAAPSRATRGSARPATGACDRRWSNSPGFGNATSPAALRSAGSASAPPRPAAARERSWSWRSRASF
jgi:transposase